MRRPLQNLLVYLTGIFHTRGSKWSQHPQILNFYFKSDFDGVLSLDSM
jgi:hypothetical protein